MQKEFNHTVKSPLKAPWYCACFQLVLLILLQINAFAQPIEKKFEALMSEPRHYQCNKTSKPVKCDGILDDEAWSIAPWSDGFQDIEGSPPQPSPYYNTQTKLAWNDSSLFIAAELEEENIWAYLDHHDDIVYRENDFEIFISNKPVDQHYYEIEVNALETVFDLFMPKPYRDGGRAMIDWNAAGIETGVHIDGTINNGHDKDKKWIVEIKIPFSSLGLDGETGLQPKANDIWRINFSRVEYDVNFTDGKYKKKIDPATGLIFPERNWAWSPQGIVNMHYPERWGYLTFLEGQNTQPDSSFNYTTEEKMKQQLWMIYYQQKESFKTNRKYITSLHELGFESDSITIDECQVQLTMIATPDMFLASARCDKKNIQFILNNAGQLEVSK